MFEQLLHYCYYLSAVIAVAFDDLQVNAFLAVGRISDTSQLKLKRGSCDNTGNKMEADLTG